MMLRGEQETMWPWRLSSPTALFHWEQGNLWTPLWWGPLIGGDDKRKLKWLGGSLGVTWGVMVMMTNTSVVVFVYASLNFLHQCSWGYNCESLRCSVLPSLLLEYVFRVCILRQWPDLESLPGFKFKNNFMKSWYHFMFHDIKWS